MLQIGLFCVKICNFVAKGVFPWQRGHKQIVCQHISCLLIDSYQLTRFQEKSETMRAAIPLVVTEKCYFKKVVTKKKKLIFQRR